MGIVAFKPIGNIDISKGGTGFSEYLVNQILIGNDEGGLSRLELLEGTNITFTFDGESLTISSTGGGGGGDGDVSGPVSSLNNELVLFSGATGKVIKASSSTGIVIVTSGVVSYATIPSGDIVGTTAEQILSNKTLTAPILGTPASGTLTNCTGLPIATGVSGLAAGVATFLVTPSSANLLAAITDETGTGSLVFATSPTLVTPNIGTPSAGTLTNCTGLPIATGISGLAAGVATFLATPSSANLIAAVTDETGTGSLVFATSPTLITPNIGTPSAGVLTNCTGLPVATGISGLATGVATFLATPSSANLIAAITDETGTGSLVFATSPTLVTPNVGTPSAGTLTNCTGLPVATGISGLAAGVATFLATPSSANLIAAITDETGTGSLVFATSPTLSSPVLTTPNIGTPSAGTLTNCTGLPVATGISGLAAGVATFLATPSSANLIAAVTDETGTGSLVFATSPTLVTPNIGTPSAGVLTNCTGLPISTGISGLAAGVATFLATPSSANLIAAVTDETGTGSLVFATSPTLVTPVLGVATATSINKVTITAPATSATLTIADGSSLITAGAFSITLTASANTSVTLPTSGTLATLAGTETFTNKRITSKVTSTTSSATPTPDVSTTDQYILTALAADATFGIPTGTPTDGQRLLVRIKDNGTARALGWNAIYRAIGVTLPTTTVVNKTLYVGMIYNSTDTKWDVIAIAQEA